MRTLCIDQLPSALVRAVATAALLTAVASSAAVAGSRGALVEGVFWQPDLETHAPKGNWHKLGADTLVVQWLVTDQKSWYATPSFMPWAGQPDWPRIQREPWARRIVAGLSGRYAEQQARDSLDQVAAESSRIGKDSLPFKPSAYYFPIEADPSWLNVCRMREAMARLPRPLWVSIYARERNPRHLDAWLNSWLPEDVKVFFQDGVGVGTRSPAEARLIADQLVRRFGRERVVIVMEAFRSANIGEGFRAAYPWEIIQQLRAYRGQRIYAFDGPHYLGDLTVSILALWAKSQSGD